mmetsp:Transcript_18596/g.40956  ORF Transcript_18596/g.40956 Transcript_18596/m.40956 type:complete len:228 (-) Transcript_18596:325-1008(-)|eukprot:CAMPEP_0116897570 /NCGR_PEP_ID=MMETSP0467-20121206/6508_1 /TAXON_ID=283647 /ORGANISM="Mesodinium pulex, Strain SPMC105" /LENGTH=227 /DNA_ID=CAMNT_0004569261 /DNA_START=421 /DNA_END=1104 /DNA_ORIENTATION=+
MHTTRNINTLNFNNSNNLNINSSNNLHSKQFSLNSNSNSTNYKDTQHKENDFDIQLRKSFDFGNQSHCQSQSNSNNFSLNSNRKHNNSFTNFNVNQNNNNLNASNTSTSITNSIKNGMKMPDNLFSFHDDLGTGTGTGNGNGTGNGDKPPLKDSKLSTKKLPYLKIFNEMYNSREFDEVTPIVETQRTGTQIHTNKINQNNGNLIVAEFNESNENQKRGHNGNVSNN